MKTLLIFRHAKSSWKEARLADHDRPLNKRGKRTAPQMGELIREEGLSPDLIISSTAKRARTTAELAAENCDFEGEMVLTRMLYHADPQTYIEVLQELAGDHAIVMVVGHNPGMEELLEDLTGVSEAFPTGALAQVDLPVESWSKLHLDARGELVNLWRPREMGLD